MSAPTRIGVGGPRPYDVLVGTGLQDRVPGLLEGADRVAIVHAGPLRSVVAALHDVLADREVRRLEVPDGEAAKTLAVAGRCWDELAAAGFTRTDAVVGLGGGAVTDLAGFVAACWLRGVPLVQVPTSLLGMVDAAIGGKTGVNLPAGKNLVGAFHPPVGVLCDLDLLATLPPAELASGLAEVVKCGFIADPPLLDLLESNDDPRSVLRELVERSVRVKAAVVGADLREAGPREVLNYGHTLGHAIERAEDFGWRHGAAVSVGLVYAAALGRLIGRLDAATADRHAAILTRLRLPVSYRPDAWPRLLDAMRLDKKARGSRLRFVVLDGVGRPGILDDPDPRLLAAAYATVTGGTP